MATAREYDRSHTHNAALPTQWRLISSILTDAAVVNTLQQDADIVHRNGTRGHAGAVYIEEEVRSAMTTLSNAMQFIVLYTNDRPDTSAPEEYFARLRLMAFHSPALACFQPDARIRYIESSSFIVLRGQNAKFQDSIQHATARARAIIGGHARSRADLYNSLLSLEKSVREIYRVKDIMDRLYRGADATFVYSPYQHVLHRIVHSTIPSAVQLFSRTSARFTLRDAMNGLTLHIRSTVALLSTKTRATYETSPPLPPNMAY